MRLAGGAADISPPSPLLLPFIVALLRYDYKEGILHNINNFFLQPLTLTSLVSVAVVRAKINHAGTLRDGPFSCYKYHTYLVLERAEDQGELFHS